MMRLPLPLIVVLAVGCLDALLRADTVATSSASFTGTVNGLRNGKLSLTLNTGAEKSLDLPDIASIALDQSPQFLAAEKLRADPLQAIAAAAAYKALIPTLNNPALKLLAEARAIDPTDRDARWTEALALFLDVYQSAPTDAVWKLRPTHIPAAPSRLLTDSADQITAALKNVPNDAVRQNLRQLLRDIYTRAGDTAAAARVTREIATGTADPPPPASSPSPVNTVALAAINTALSAKDYASALRQIDPLLPTATGESAVQLFSLKARAFEGQNQLESAVALWLRIPAHYPASPAAPAALQRAADLQQQLNHLAEAQALLAELRSAYPNSPEAAKLGAKQNP
jgi:hypothetical protein